LKSDNNQKEDRNRKKAERAKARKEFKAAVNMELREHRSSFVAFSILRALVIVSMVRQFFLGNYEGMFLGILTLLLLFLPSIVQVTFKIELPTTLEIIMMTFVFAAEILGEINRFYIIIPFWDTMLHTLNGFLAAAVGFSLVVLLNKNKNKNVAFEASPIFVAIVAFCFSMTIGVVWEFFEFTMDRLFQLDMQKDTVVHVISSVMLNSTGANKPVMISGITDVTVNGQSLGLGGYLDIGLIDTMKDLFVNFIGAITFSVIGFFYLQHKGKGTMAERFIPREKDSGRDYLEIAKELEESSETAAEPARQEKER